MKQLILALGIITGFISLDCIAQEDKEINANIAIKTIQSSVAGFSPIFLGRIETGKTYTVTFYSIFWTNPSFGNLESGSDLLLETGAGLAYNIFNDKLMINPSLGISHGKFSSNSSGTKLAEGLVPNLYFNFNHNLLELEGYIAYYKSLRDNKCMETKDYLLHWVAPGIEVSKLVSLGVFYESFEITRIEGNPEKPKIYQWLGGSIKLKLNKGIAFRFSAGKNLNTDVNTSSEFYKASCFIPF